jgi:hypothetical protein
MDIAVSHAIQQTRTMLRRDMDSLMIIHFNYMHLFDNLNNSAILRCEILNTLRSNFYLYITIYGEDTLHNVIDMVNRK